MSSAAAHIRMLDLLQAGCQPARPGLRISYGYVPSIVAGSIFVTLFSLTCLAHIFQMCKTRRWWCSVLVVGALAEIIGWAGRLWGAKCPYNLVAFMIQVSCLIIAPSFITAGIYIILGRQIDYFGRGTSRLSPKAYLWIFCTCDLISLIIQASGGGLASSESNKKISTKPGTYIMVAGILFQLVSITFFLAFFAEFLLKSRKMQSARNSEFKKLQIAMIISVACIYVRSIYRTVELLQGWRGYLMTHEPYFIAFDAVLIIISLAVFNVYHPGTLLNRLRQTTRQVQPEVITCSTDSKSETSEDRKSSGTQV